MKILFVADHLKGNSGWSRYALDIISAVRKEGVEVLCLVYELAPETDIPQKKCLGEPLTYVANLLRSLISAVQVKRAIREFSPDIIQFIVEPYGTMIPFLRKGNARIVLNAHSTFAFLPILVSGIRRTFATVMTRWTYARTDAVIAISRYTAQYLVRHMTEIHAEQTVKDKITVMGGGIKLPSVSTEFARPPHIPREILCVGAVKSRKGIKEALDALVLVKSDFVFHIVGSYRDDDSYVHILRDKIKEYGLEKKVILTGQLSDVELNNLYDNADLFLMLSTNNGKDFEGYGLVYLEANAHGIPCIGPKDSGVSDAIVDGKTGYLVNQYDSAAVARTIDHVLNDRPINSADCLAWAQENSIENRAKTMMSVYKNIMV